MPSQFHRLPSVSTVLVPASVLAVTAVAWIAIGRNSLEPEKPRPRDRAAERDAAAADGELEEFPSELATPVILRSLRHHEHLRAWTTTAELRCVGQRCRDPLPRRGRLEIDPELRFEWPFVARADARTHGWITALLRGDDDVLDEALFRIGRTTTAQHLRRPGHQVVEFRAKRARDVALWAVIHEPTGAIASVVWPATADDGSGATWWTLELTE